MTDRWQLTAWSNFEPGHCLVLYMSYDKFLLTVESRDLSQAIIQVSSFPKLFLNNKVYSYTKNNYLALGNLAKVMFWSILSFKNLQV